MGCLGTISFGLLANWHGDQGPRRVQKQRWEEAREYAVPQHSTLPRAALPPPSTLLVQPVISSGGYSKTNKLDLEKEDQQWIIFWYFTIWFKSTHILKNPLFVAFLDFKQAFDSISGNTLWEKLKLTIIDKCLLFLIQNLDNNIAFELWVNPNLRTVGNLKKMPEKPREQPSTMELFLGSKALDDLICPKGLEELQTFHVPSPA
ncbi:hypothetical protein L345_16276 [Ophiophagus hannah]|uniref:Reverse transcriptase domain-containing protein n=1 Tax=Ophiophagus hannah TaxID=8665 RepID=V8N8N7_OPHHA|nr:hypothetical protein L345_16276 [Ophiophagus hannah]